MSHTPGPWRIVPRLHEESLCAVMGADGHLVVNLGDGGNGEETQRANASLIAAAPEMLEALKKIWGGGTPSGEQARIAAEIVEKLDPEWAENGDAPKKKTVTP